MDECNVAISLTKIGYDSIVSIEINGEWVPVIENGGDIISHIVEPLGIKEAIKREKRGRQVSDWSPIQ